jgi:ADP-heptose:LPS heptosyltransferase
MNKNFKLFSGRASLIGDTIMFLPALNYLETKYPNSYKIFPISKKTSQSAPLFINHPLIDKIYVLEQEESLSVQDIKLIKDCDLAINPFPNHPDVKDWYNYYNCIEETIRMAGINLKEFNSLPVDLKKPKLEKWFKISKNEKTIAIWPFACYGVDTGRNPSIEWWQKLLKILDKDYRVFHFGADAEPNLGEGLNNYYKLTNLSFLEMIKITLGCDLSIGTDSGSSWVIGAYGFPQINLILKNSPEHKQNFNAFSPENYLNNKIDLIGLNGKDSINIQDLLNSINKIL